MAILGREVIDERRQPTREIEVPEWGGSILLRKLSATEVPKLIAMATSAFDQESRQLKDPGRMTQMLSLGIFWSWVNEQGGQVLINRDKDMEWLGTQPYELLDRLGDVINEWNGIKSAAVADAKKNSATSQSDDFGTI